MIEKLKNPEVRRYIYYIASALVPILVISGVLIEEQTGLILTLVGAILGFSTMEMAALNTNVGETDTTDELQEETPADYSDLYDGSNLGELD